MNLFRSLFSDGKTAFYTVALGLVVATLFVARLRPEWPLNTGAILILFIAWLWEGRFPEKFSRLRNWWTWLPLVVFILYLLGALYSENQVLAWGNIERKLSLPLLLFFIVSASSFKREHKVWSLFVFVVSAITALAMAYVVAGLKGLGLSDQMAWTDLLTYDRLATSIGMQPIYFSFYLVFAFFGLLYLFKDPDSKGQWFYQHTRLAVLSLLFLFIGIIMLSSRMEIVVLFATGGLLILLFMPSAKARKRYALILGAAVLGAVVIILTSADNRERFREMFDLSADYTENKYGGRSIRLHKWKNTIECWSQSPFFGVGTGDMQDALNKTYERNNFELALENQFNPHNQYLQTLLTLGVPGLLALLIWLWSCWWWGWRYKNWLLFAFGTVVSLSILTESMLERQWGVVFIALFWTILITDNFEYFRKEPIR